MRLESSLPGLFVFRHWELTGAPTSQLAVCAGDATQRLRLSPTAEAKEADPMSFKSQRVACGPTIDDVSHGWLRDGSGAAVRMFPNGVEDRAS
jgi:hypothetical protein